MKKRDSRQSVFDFDGDEEKGSDKIKSSQRGIILHSSPPIWHEVPQALFLSWSRARQALYCALRDEDAAAREDDLKGWFLERAAGYREDAR